MQDIDNDDIHRDYTTRVANDAVFGNATLKIEDCPCEPCRTKEKEPDNLLHRAMKTSANNAGAPFKTECPCQECVERSMRVRNDIRKPAVNPFSVNEESFKWKR